MIIVLYIIGGIAGLLFAMYKVGPGYNKSKEEKKNKEWIEQWKKIKP